MAVIAYKDPESKGKSFRGVGIFNHGILHNTPFTCVNEFRERFSFSLMQNGRPADGSFFTSFYGNGKT